jgi:acyl carrier protein
MVVAGNAQGITSAFAGSAQTTKLSPLVNSYVAVNIPPAGNHTASALRMLLQGTKSDAIETLGRHMNSATDRVTALVNRMLTERSLPLPAFPDTDLRSTGLSSLDMVNLVLSVESEFDVSIPDADITPARFRSIATIAMLVAALLSRREAA